MEIDYNPDNVKLAKALLRIVLAEKPRTLAEVHAYIKGQGIRKRDLKIARKELGVATKQEQDVWVWSLPLQNDVTE